MHSCLRNFSLCDPFQFEFAEYGRSVSMGVKSRVSKTTLIPARILLIILLNGLVIRAQGEPLKSTTAKLPTSAQSTRTKITKAAKVDFTRDVRPLLANKCFACHGLDDKKRQANLRLDVRENALVRLASGTSPIVPGKPQASLILQRIKAMHALQMPPESTGKRLTPQEITTLETWIAQGAVYLHALQMPPESTGKRLTPQEITTLETWIAQGAVYTPHWAFRKPEIPAIPIVKMVAKTIAKNGIGARNPIDRFVLARLEQEGLTPAPEADRYTLLRRLSLDLIGLPPTPAEVQAFVVDRSPMAYEAVVDRLLSSPHYGEKWARMWLDLARFADSAGYGSDPLRPNLWPYRDWVIDAFNRDMPYNRFTLEQIAGDLLPNPTQDQLVATAFHRNTMTNTEGGTSREEFRTSAVKDRATTTSQVFMGLTMGCAQCHSHKFDPITQKEFYSFFAFFNQTEDNDQPNETPTISFETEAQKQKRVALTADISALQAKSILPQSADLKAKLTTEITRKQKELAELKTVSLPIMRELPSDKRRISHVLTLSNFLQPAEQVEPGTPVAFSSFPPNAPKNRLGLAQWLISPNNPLMARVAVNRYWAQLFGVGIVETEEDFGLQGALPTHPELLDWLACNFTAANGCNWSMKKLVRLLVTSATYRQSSRVTPKLLEKDPRNRLLARYPRRRLEAELVRDQALTLSGLLSLKIGGPSVFPPQPGGLWQAAFNGDRTYPTSVGEDRYRRGLYTFWRRTVPYPSMATFDAPSREICTMRRMPTNTPLQALVTLNDPVYVEMAQALGRRIAREGGTTLLERARYALTLALCRPPKPEEVQTLVSLFDKESAYYRAHPDDAKRLATDPIGPLPDGMDSADQATWTIVGNVLLNLDGVLNKS